MQLASCASDGLVKVWNVKDENCATTLDNHEEKVRRSSRRAPGTKLTFLVAPFVDLGSGCRP